MKFQFPSNGKAYPKLGNEAETTAVTTVNKFQFPSNGKAYPKRVAMATFSFVTVAVSIPFKREGVSKGE